MLCCLRYARHLRFDICMVKYINHAQTRLRLLFTSRIKLSRMQRKARHVQRFLYIKQRETHSHKRLRFIFIRRFESSHGTFSARLFGLHESPQDFQHSFETRPPSGAQRTAVSILRMDNTRAVLFPRTSLSRVHCNM
jgi:hypothetical protein